jgi:hypothetical protein
LYSTRRRTLQHLWSRMFAASKGEYAKSYGKFRLITFAINSKFVAT